MRPRLLRNLGCLCVLSGLSLVGSRPAHGDPAILKGLAKSFAVTVEPLDQDGRRSGLTEGGLAKVIQSRLTRRKVTATPGGDQEIYTRVVVLTSNDVSGKVLGYGAHIELSCRAKAVLKRDGVTEFMAPIWFKGNVTVSNPQVFVADVARALAGLTDEFLSEYAVANP